MQPVVKIKCKSNKKKNKINRNIEYQKKDIRITSDATDLNAQMKRQPRAMPCVVDLKHALNKKAWFSKLDIKDAFNTIPLSAESQKLTTFTTEWGLYRYLRLNMGICIASEIFNDVMISKFSDIENCKVAMDYILITGETIEDHDTALLKTCQRLVDLNLTLSKKSVFCQPEVTFFGMLISAAGIKPTTDKVNDFLETLAPQNAAELASFLGLATYFSERIPHLAPLRQPFKNLEKAGNAFIWDDSHQKAFKDIKASLIQTCLGHYDVNKNTELWVDASPVGSAAFLVQSFPNDPKSRTLVAGASRSFSEIEQNYTQMEKEAFACLWACEHIHIYIMGTKFDLLTDNKAVKLTMGSRTDTKRKTPLRVKHWRSRMTKYSGMQPKHIPGVNNIADFLSRCLKHKIYVPCSDITPSNSFEAFAAKVEAVFSIQTAESSCYCSFDELKAASHNDSRIQLVKRRILANNKPTKFDADTVAPYHKFWNEMNISPEGLLMRNDRIVIPHSLTDRLLKFCHEGHLGINATKRLIRHRYYFPGMDDEIETLCLGCLACQCNVNKTQKSPIISGVLADGPRILWSIDFSSRTPDGNYILVLFDEFSSFPIFEFSRGLTSRHAIRILRTVFKKFGTPKIVKSDNGPAFISTEFAEFAKEMNFHHQLITPEWPQANATCERLMSSINKRIRCAQVDKQDWKSSLKAFVERYRATPHVSRGHTPNELMGLTDTNLLPSKLQSVPVSDLIESAKLSDANAKRIQEKYADMHKKKRPIFERGDIVLCRQKTPTKHTPYFNTEPYTITDIKGTMVTAKNATHTITRNESYFKWFNGIIPTRQTIINSQSHLFIQPVSLLLERITPPPLTPT